MAELEVDNGIGPAITAWTSNPDAPDWVTEGDGPEWTQLPDGWIGVSLPGFPHHTVAVLPDLADPDHPRIAGLRIEPATEGTPPLLARQLSSVRLPVLARFAADAARWHLARLPKSHRRVLRQPKPSRAELAKVDRLARERGETPARAIMREFQVARPTAYVWLKGV